MNNDAPGNFYSPQEIRRTLFLLELQIENVKTMIGIQQKQFDQIEQAMQVIRADIRACAARHDDAENYSTASTRLEPQRHAAS